MIVDVHLNIDKNLIAKQCLHQERIELEPAAAPPPPPFPHPLLPPLFALFLLLWCCNFHNTTLDKFQLHSQVCLSQINVEVPIQLKFKFFAIFLE